MSLVLCGVYMVNCCRVCALVVIYCCNNRLEKYGSETILNNLGRSDGCLPGSPKQSGRLEVWQLWQPGSVAVVVRGIDGIERSNVAVVVSGIYGI